MFKKLAMGAAVAAISAGTLLAGSASATVNLVKNGGFEMNGGPGQVNGPTTLAFWTAKPATQNYDFLFKPAPGVSGTDADTTGVLAASGQTIKLWGPGDGSANGLTLSPDGGYFLAIDPVYHNNGPLTQTISGLTKGFKYLLTFNFAGAQQRKYLGATTEGWKVTFGTTTQSTPTLLNASKGFTGWKTASMSFTADAATQDLKFLATGGPTASLPPFALLDGVSLTGAGVPEPASWALMILGFGGVGAMVRGRRRQAIA
jgi:hypothetical protein